MDTQDIINLRDEIDKFKDVALSTRDILDIVDGKANVVLYSQIHTLDSIDDLLKPYGAAVILYETHENYGHWTCLTLRDEYTKKGRQILEFYDSYGLPFDAQLKDIPKEFAEKTFQDQPYLSKLIIKDNCPYRLSYNEFQFQELTPNTKDCGRWCALRILLKELPLKVFRDFFYGLYSDDLVTILTMNDSQLK